MILKVDHPRLRGEHLQELGVNPNRSGSPPPTRGTLTAIRQHVYSSRITPAYAGNTALLILAVYKSWDHPRLRGEHMLFALFWMFC